MEQTNKLMQTPLEPYTAEDDNSATTQGDTPSCVVTAELPE